MDIAVFPLLCQVAPHPVKWEALVEGHPPQ